MPKKQLLIILLIAVSILMVCFFATLYLLKPKVDQTAIFKPDIIETSQIIAGKPVKWIAVISAKDIAENGRFLQLPKTAKDITVKIADKNQKDASLNAVKSIQITEKDRQTFAKNNSRSMFTAGLIEPVAGFFSDLFYNLKDMLNPKIVTGAEDKFYDLSGEILGETNYIEVQYQTPAPTISEKSFSNKKEATIKNDSSLNYANVLVYTTIPEIFNVGQESKIKIKWKNNGNQEMEFRAYDLDKNEKLDYVEWTVPHLSEQTFEIIYISRAFELDENKEIVNDIYEQAKEKDGVWVTVPAGHYVRATFKKILDNTKDITIYAKSAESGTPSTIEVYPVYTDADGNATEGPIVATFENIDKENTYKIYLTNLQTPTDVFDLKIVNGDVDIDQAVDPPVTLYWVGNAGANVSVATNWKTTDPAGCGSGDASAAPGASDTAIFDPDCDNGAVVDITDWSLTPLTLMSGYAGTFDNATNDKNINVSGNVIMDNTRTDMGDGTWTVGGDFDVKDVGTFNRNSSTLVMTGSGKTLTGAWNKALNNFTLSGSVTTSGGIWIWGTVLINEGASFAAANGTQFRTGTATNNGTVSGIMQLFDATLVNNGSWNTTTTTAWSDVTLNGSTYNGTWNIAKQWGGATFTFAGNVIFTGNVAITADGSAHVFTVDLGTNNASLTFQGNLSLAVTYAGASITWTKGTGTITLGDNPADGTQTINFLDKTVEDIVVNASGDTKQFTDGVTTVSFTGTAGTIDLNSQTISTTGDFTIGTSGNVDATNLDGSTINVGGDFDVAGSNGDLLTLNASAPWYLNVTGTGTASYVNVAYSDASGGSAISQTNSTDSDNNTNWLFDSDPPVPSNFSPASASTIRDSTPTITFDLDENGDCFASTTDESYDDMSDNDDCTGDGTTLMSCTLSDLGVDGEKNVYIACKDTAYSNKDTVDTNENLTYTLDTTPFSKWLEGNLWLRGNIIFK